MRVYVLRTGVGRAKFFTTCEVSAVIAQPSCTTLAMRAHTTNDRTRTLYVLRAISALIPHVTRTLRAADVRHTQPLRFPKPALMTHVSVRGTQGIRTLQVVCLLPSIFICDYPTATKSRNLAHSLQNTYVLPKGASGCKGGGNKLVIIAPVISFGILITCTKL